MYFFHCNMENMIFLYIFVPEIPHLKARMHTKQMVHLDKYHKFFNEHKSLT